MMKHNATIFAFGLMIVLILIFGCSDSKTPTATAPSPIPNGIIVAMGDSLTEGLGVDETQTYPAILEKRLAAEGYHFKVINAGVSGETSSGALSRIEWILSLKPDIVILCTGANDGFRGIDPSLVTKNIRTMIARLKEQDVTIVLAGMKMVENMGKSYTQMFNSLYETIAREEQVIFIPFFLEGVATRRSMNQPDGVHPNARGYQVIVENLYPFVKQAIKVNQDK
ncbi:MAG: arylesterase [Desulfatirhabdiaceae bacterium]